MSKSEIMRKMYDEGKSISEISKEMGCIYSYVYGVIDRYELSRGNNIRGKNKKGENKSDKIREMYKEGKEIGDICREMMKEGIYVNYSYVWSVVDKERKSDK